MSNDDGTNHPPAPKLLEGNSNTITRAIPDFSSKESVTLDHTNVYQYLHQFYHIGTAMSRPKFFLIQSVGKSSDAWEIKKKVAIEDSITPTYDSMMSKYAEHRDSIYLSDSDVDIEDYYSGYTYLLLDTYTRDMYSRNMKKLEYNYIFDIGFKLIDQCSGTNQLCQCPCNKAYKSWRDKHNIYLTPADSNCGLEDLVTPQRLIKHLREKSKEDSFFHKGILTYLENLYKDSVPIFGKQNKFYNHYAIIPDDNNRSRNQLKIKNELMNYECLSFKFINRMKEYHTLLTDQIISTLEYQADEALRLVPTTQSFRRTEPPPPVGNRIAVVDNTSSTSVADVSTRTTTVINNTSLTTVDSSTNRTSVDVTNTNNNDE